MNRGLRKLSMAATLERRFNGELARLFKARTYKLRLLPTPCRIPQSNENAIVGLS